MLEEILMFGISALVGLVCLGGGAWIALNPETLDVDKIFGIIACLVLALVFLGVAAWMLFNTRLRELWRKQPEAAAPQARDVAAKETLAKKEVIVPQQETLNKAS